MSFEQLQQDLKLKFNIEDANFTVKRDDLASVTVGYEQLMGVLLYLKQSTSYSSLATITCADWLEDGFFTVSYILDKIDKTKTLMVQTNISRDENCKIQTLSDVYTQAQVMERDLHEMYGIDFIGNDNLKEFSLEQWVHTPPLRRDFDTLEFVNEQYEFRPGRDDNIDVKAETKRLRAIKKEKEAKLKAEQEEKETAQNIGDNDAK